MSRELIEYTLIQSGLSQYESYSGLQTNLIGFSSYKVSPSVYEECNSGFFLCVKQQYSYNGRISFKDIISNILWFGIIEPLEDDLIINNNIKRNNICIPSYYVNCNLHKLTVSKDCLLIRIKQCPSIKTLYISLSDTIFFDLQEVSNDIIKQNIRTVVISQLIICLSANVSFKIIDIVDSFDKHVLFGLLGSLDGISTQSIDIVIVENKDWNYLTSEQVETYKIINPSCSWYNINEWTEYNTNKISAINIINETLLTLNNNYLLHLIKYCNIDDNNCNGALNIDNLTCINLIKIHVNSYSLIELNNLFHYILVNNDKYNVNDNNENIIVDDNNDNIIIDDNENIIDVAEDVIYDYRYSDNEDNDYIEHK